MPNEIANYGEEQMVQHVHQQHLSPSLQNGMDNLMNNEDASEFVLIDTEAINGQMEVAEQSLAEMIAARTPVSRRRAAKTFSQRLKSSSKRH
jgi:hypothetical protein